MPSSIEALKQAVQLEEQALDQYIIAMDSAVHEETKQTLKEYADDKQQKIDTLSWMIMAESGDLEKEESAPQNGSERLAAGKCPFSRGDLEAMGIDMSQSTMGLDDDQPKP